MIAKWGSQPGGWTKIMLVYAVPLTIVGLFRFFFIKEEVEDETAGVQKKDDITLKEGLKAIAKNKFKSLPVREALLKFLKKKKTSRKSNSLKVSI